MYDRAHPVAWYYRPKGVMPMNSIIEILSLVAVIKVADLLTTWLKEKSR